MRARGRRQESVARKATREALPAANKGALGHSRAPPILDSAAQFAGWAWRRAVRQSQWRHAKMQASDVSQRLGPARRRRHCGLSCCSLSLFRCGRFVWKFVLHRALARRDPWPASQLKVNWSIKQAAAAAPRCQQAVTFGREAPPLWGQRIRGICTSVQDAPVRAKVAPRFEQN